MKVFEQLQDIRNYLDSKEEETFMQKEVYQIVLGHLNSKIKPFYYESFRKGRGDLRPLIRKSGPRVVMEAIDISAEQYLEYENEKPTKDSVEKFYLKIGGIAYNKSKGIEL
jgi:hypothetical protein